jgi:hypothetical protein
MEGTAMVIQLQNLLLQNQSIVTGWTRRIPDIAMEKTFLDLHLRNHQLGLL